LNELKKDMEGEREDGVGDDEEIQMGM